MLEWPRWIFTARSIMQRLSTESYVQWRSFDGMMTHRDGALRCLYSVKPQRNYCKRYRMHSRRTDTTSTVAPTQGAISTSKNIVTLWFTLIKLVMHCNRILALLEMSDVHFTTVGTDRPREGIVNVCSITTTSNSPSLSLPRSHYYCCIYQLITISNAVMQLAPETVSG